MEGARKGWTVGVNSILPNVLMAYVLIQILRVSGVLDILGSIFNPVMARLRTTGQSGHGIAGVVDVHGRRRRGGRKSVRGKCPGQDDM